MKKILFVCYGNQCRSPMAEYLLNSLLANEHLDTEYKAESAGTLPGISFQPIYSSARRKLEEHGIDGSMHEARNVVWGDYDRYEKIICMDDKTLKDTAQIVDIPFGKINRIREDEGIRHAKICKLMDFVEDKKGIDVSDPMVTGDFDKAWEDLQEGCDGLLQYLKESGNR